MPCSEGKWAGASAFERIPDDEERLIDEMHALLKEKMSKDYPAGQTKRDAHPKNLACLHAEFIVEPHIPAELKAGIFAFPSTYPAWVRISSSSGKIQSDRRQVKGVTAPMYYKPEPACLKIQERMIRYAKEATSCCFTGNGTKCTGFRRFYGEHYVAGQCQIDNGISPQTGGRQGGGCLAFSH